jgi:phosphoribosyl 1,2-cyclic phosphodiesterase
MQPNDKSAVTVRFRGVRGSIPSPGPETARYGGNTSCVELRTGSDILILDAGSGIRNLGKDLIQEFGPRPIEANLLITHTHWDHIQGLPFFVPLYSARNRIRIISAMASAATLQRALRNQMQAMHFPVGFEQMRGLAGIEQLTSGRIGRFTVTTFALNHPGGCAGVRIEAAGATIAYLPDHEPYRRSAANAETERRAKTLAQFVYGADALILDTQYTGKEYPGYIGWGHGCLPDSVALAIEAKVDRLVLFHHDPSRSDERIDEMLEEAQRQAAPSSLQVLAAAENDCLVLGATKRCARPKEVRPLVARDGGVSEKVLA